MAPPAAASSCFAIPTAGFSPSIGPMSDRKIDREIIGCEKLIDLPAGMAAGNHSFGGGCVLESHSKRTDVRICRDLMLGRFSIEPFDRRGERDQDPIEFTNQRCFGG